jgi:lysophospholipase L1-like esterase
MVWYEDEVKRLEAELTALSYEPRLVFYGSSSIRLWDGLKDDFEMYMPVNLGFGGSTLEACVFFFKRIMKCVHPQHLIVYAGDNDLGDGKSPLQVHGYFMELCRLINESFKDLPVTFISIKPSITRWDIRHNIQYTNSLIEASIVHKPNMAYLDVYNSMISTNGLPEKDLFDADGLHLNHNGYKLWKEIVLTHISSKNDRSLTSMA